MRISDWSSDVCSSDLQSDGSYLTPEGEKLTKVVAKAAYLRTVQDWIIRPQMRTVQGVAGVDSNGGYVKQYVVEPNLTAVASYGVSVTDVADALERARTSIVEVTSESVREDLGSRRNNKKK